MAKRVHKKVTVVDEHLLHVPVSERNPDGITTRRTHIRRLKGTYLDEAEIESIYKSYDRKGLIYPKKGKLKQYPDADKYDDQIAVWTDYFNKKFKADPPLDPDSIKALIGSESGFRSDPSKNKKAFGITQITPETWKILQDPNGEAKEFIFRDIRKKDLKNPDIAIPMAIRWLHRKKETAANRILRTPTQEEIILEYKGLLKSKSGYKNDAFENYRKKYDLLKGK